jgi:Arginase/agmatinase/formimionoglutamate hydrolase, arginase family
MTTRERVKVQRGWSGLNTITADVGEVAPAYDQAEVTPPAAATMVDEITNKKAKSKGKDKRRE